MLGQDAGDLGGALDFTTDATATSPAGSYRLAPGGLTSRNYAITYVDGSLTVTTRRRSSRSRCRTSMP